MSIWLENASNKNIYTKTTSFESIELDTRPESMSKTKSPVLSWPGQENCIILDQSFWNPFELLLRPLPGLPSLQGRPPTCSWPWMAMGTNVSASLVTSRAQRSAPRGAWPLGPDERAHRAGGGASASKRRTKAVAKWTK